MKTVSVIVPVYNTARHLKKCIDSIIKQNYENLDVVAIDDCSTDGSGEILINYEKRWGGVNPLYISTLRVFCLRRIKALTMLVSRD